ncbi:MAG: OmcA/MtrC family decaheme c-type cytochrome [Chloroflexi bacterium]|nr:OmcA/MtrC family decaheme c-type cytochrome [Chloroflexota bacterium]
MLLGLGLAIGSAALISAPRSRFTVHDKAYYQPESQVEFIRPGILFKITQAAIASDGTISATFKITDPEGLPLDLNGISTPGPVTVSMTAAYIPNDGVSEQYTNYVTVTVTDPASGRTATQATVDQGGIFRQIGDGIYTYTFITKAAQFDPTATHSIGGQAVRNLSEFDLGTQASDDVFTFVPNGNPVTTIRDVVSTAACNQCHDPLAVHGGTRKDIQYCVLCHTPQASDPITGNSLNMSVMVHKIHFGPNLPTVKAGGKYQLAGDGGALNDFSGTTFARDIRECTNCHQQASQSTNFKTCPDRAACGSCHDDVDFASGKNHVNLPQDSDDNCSQCHAADAASEFDASVPGAHTIPARSKQLPGVNFEILKVENAVAGGNPTVTFTIKDDAGNPVAPSSMEHVALVLGGPATDYARAVVEDVSKVPGPSDSYAYTFSYQIPKDATGTWTIGIEGAKTYTLNPGTVLQASQNQGGVNKLVSFSVDGSQLQPRRTVVSLQNCNNCHSSLSAHGGNRNQIEMCVLCHNPNATDADVRPAAKNPPEAIDFRTMIHKIHIGNDLTSDYMVYGYRGSVNQFNGVTFPGDRRDCSKCHVNGSEELPLGANLLSLTTPRDYITTTQPETAACLACHTAKSTAAHALSNTATFGESCDVCHGREADFSVDKVHAR